MKTLFIINPQSGMKTIQKSLDHIIGQLVLKQIIQTIDVFYTQQKNDAKIKCESLNQDDYDLIISVGGDGTLNEVINGMMNAHLSIPLAILAGGTVNDFAKFLNLPTHPQEFIDMIQDFHTISVDIGQANDSYFINVIAGGMFSDIGYAVSQDQKEKLGSLAYYYNGLMQLPSQLATQFHLTIESENYNIHETSKLFMITNSSHVAGIKDLTPRASIQDGLLDVFVIKNCSTTDMIALVKDYTLFYHTENPYVHYFQTNELSLYSDDSLIYDIDGERGERLPIHIRVIPQALKILVPLEKKKPTH